MTTITELNNTIAFSEQINPVDLKDIVQRGYQQIICNRPDNEDQAQPSAQIIEEAAKKHGIDFVFAPVANGSFSHETLHHTHQALSNGHKTLMYCRSGTRSIILWAIIQVHNGSNPETVMEFAQNAGYDINYLKDFIVNASQF